MKKCILGLILISIILFLIGCENIDLSKVSDEDLERVSEQAIKCEKPYIRFGTSCCLDQNDNKICDRDEKVIEVVETPSKEVIVGKCTLPAGIACTDFLVTPEGIASVLQNGLGFDIDQVSVDISGCGSGVGGLDYGDYLANGNRDRYVISCPLTGSEFNGDMIVNYRNTETDLTHRVQGTISAIVDIYRTVEMFLPSKCTLPAGIACTDFLVGKDGVAIVLRNGAGFDMDKISVSVSGCDDESIGVTYEGRLDNGYEDTYFLSCNTGLSGSEFTRELNVTYTNVDTTLVHRVQGTLSTTIEDKSMEELGVPERFLPEKCTLPAGLACVSHKVEPTTATLIISNGLGKTISLDSVFVGNCGFEYAGGLVIKSGEEKRVDIEGCNYGNSGNKFEGEIELGYTDPATSLTYTIYGRIETTIE